MIGYGGIVSMPTLRYKKSIYPLDIIKKAAFVFTEYAYILLDEEEDSYLVSFTPKNVRELREIEGEFNNELLSQLVREVVWNKTRGIRELVYNRALSSSIILENDKVLDEETGNTMENVSLTDILKDWFSDKDDKI